MANNDLPFLFYDAPETVKPPVPARTASGSTQVTNTIAFGNGLKRPFVRDGRGDWSHASDISVVRANVGQVLGTMASSASTAGEVPWRPEFGSLVQLLRFRNLDETTAELARTYVVDALRNWLFRVRVVDSDVVLDFDNSQLIITIVYDILATNRTAVVAQNQSVTAAVPVAA